MGRTEGTAGHFLRAGGREGAAGETLGVPGGQTLDRPRGSPVLSTPAYVGTRQQDSCWILRASMVGREDLLADNSPP